MRLLRAYASFTGLLAIVSFTCLCSAGESIQRTVDDLYADAPQQRSAAARRLITIGQNAVPYIDPFKSGCLDPATRPARCKNYDKALREIIAALERIAVEHEPAGVTERNAAKDLLWTMLNDPAEDAFDLEAHVGRDPAVGAGLKQFARASLDRAMSIPDDLREEEASRRAVGRAQDQELGWYLLENCAGASMYAGCNYGSYVFSRDGTRASFRLIHHEDRDSVGAGVTVELFLDAGLKHVGYLRARGGFGGGGERLVFYRLRPNQTPLCALISSDSQRDVLSSHRKFVSVSVDGCKSLQENSDLTLEDYVTPQGLTRPEPGEPPRRPKPRDTPPPPAPPSSRED